MAMTFTYDSGPGRIQRVIASWTSDASGDADGTTKKIVGRLIKGVTDPGAAAPTASYDIVITDPEGLNVLSPCTDDLADRHTSNTEEVYFLLSDGTVPISMHPAVCDPLTITVSNAGASKSGELILYVDIS